MCYQLIECPWLQKKTNKQNQQADSVTTLIMQNIVTKYLFDNIAEYCIQIEAPMQKSLTKAPYVDQDINFQGKSFSTIRG